MPVSMNPTTILPLLQGFMLCASLVVVFGPQNLFLLQQGLHGRYLFATACACTLVDLLLISLGVGGVGRAISANPQMLLVATLVGIGFLFGYGVRAFRIAWCGCSASNHLARHNSNIGLKGTLLTALSFSLLNPAAYIDTLLMIGSASGHYPLDERILFGVGAALASALWFFTLLYAASRLTPLFRHAMAWRLLDVVSGSIMFGLAGSLFAAQSPLFW